MVYSRQHYAPTQQGGTIHLQCTWRGQRVRQRGGQRLTRGREGDTKGGQRVTQGVAVGDTPYLLRCPPSSSSMWKEFPATEDTPT
ncbi:hypothetical protein FKM82_004557 [Ascaphus truei]